QSLPGRNGQKRIYGSTLGEEEGAMMRNIFPTIYFLLLAPVLTHAASAPDKLVGIHSARVMSQSLPWMAEEAGLFKKHNIDFNLVFISSSSIVTAALLGGDAEMTLTGGIGNVIAYVRGSTDVVFVGGVKNVMTQSLVAGGALKRPEDLKGKRIAVSRIGGNTHYFTIQALRRHGLEPNRDFSFMQSGGDPEALAALMTGNVEAAALTPPSDAKALANGFKYVLYGPDLKIPYAATAFVTRRSVIAKRPQMVGNFMRAMAEAAKIMHSDREFVYKVLGKYLRVTEKSILDAAYNAEIKALEPRLAIKTEALQATLEEIAVTDPRAKKVTAQELIDSRYLDEMEKSGFFDQLWAKK
ncbi:MAG TPA: ABC transporter substrate-binding protein, partial [Candidatus Binatia bacterium]|nr:ABC transporter substrate-binding protein [Candidatus Binatia bacterium]